MFLKIRFFGKHHFFGRIITIGTIDKRYKTVIITRIIKIGYDYYLRIGELRIFILYWVVVYAINIYSINVFVGFK